MAERAEGARAALAVIAGAALLGLAPIGVRLSDLGPQATNLWRFVFALPILAALALAGAPKPAARDIGLLLIAGLLFGQDLAFWAQALSFTTVVNATLLANMTPVVAAAFAWFLFREHPKRGVLIGGAAALVGAIVLAMARARGAQGPTHDPALGWLGDALGFSAAFGYAGYLLIVRAFGTRVSVGAVMFWATLSAAGLAFAACLVLHEPLLAHSVRGWIILVGLGVFVQAGGQGLIAYGVARLPIAVSTILLWTQPLAAAVLSWMLFNEALSPLALAGAALILGGVYAVQRSR